MQLRRIIAFCAALAIAVTAPAFAQNNQQQQPKRSKAEQADIDALVLAVNAATASGQMPQDVKVTWEMHHFMKAPDGQTVFPFVVAIDRGTLPAKEASVYVRIIEKQQLAALSAQLAEAAKNAKDKNAVQVTPQRYAWENIYFLDMPADGKLARAVAVPPGEYEAFIAVKEKAKDDKSKTPPKIGMVRQSLTVPDYNAGLTTSQVIVAREIQQLEKPLSQKEALEQPYVFGPLRIVPTLDATFPKASELSVVFWVYGAGLGANNKPDVQIDYNFHQKLAEGEKFFNRTAPMALNATTLPPEFDFAAGHQLTGIQSVPLGSFPPGDYRLEIKVTDKAAANKTVTQNVNFTVAP